MRYLSVCSGIEAASAAWHELGWTPVAFSEIEPFPSAVLAQRFPGVPNWGDMTKFKEWPDADVDVLVGGTPCQSFSVAGLRKGLDDPRGSLMLVFLAIAARYRPRYVVWENVPGVLSSGGGRDFGSFLGALGQLGYGWAYRVLDAQWFGVAQRRRRVFVVGCAGDQRRAAQVLFEREGVCRDPAPSRAAGERPAPSLAARTRGGGGLGTDTELDGGLIASTGNISHCLNAGGMGRQDYETETLVAHALRGEGIDASEDSTGRGTPLVPVHAFDARQSDVIQYGDRTGPLDTDGHSVAVAFTTEQTPKFSAGKALTLTKQSPTGGGQPQCVAFAQNSRDEVRLQGGDGQIVGALAADHGVQQQNYVALTHNADDGEINGPKTEGYAAATLRALRDTVGAKAFAEWGSGILDPLQSSEVLRAWLHGSSVRRAADEGKPGVDDGALSREKELPAGELRLLWERGPDGRSPQGRELAKQLAVELGASLPQLPHQGASQRLQVRRLTPREAERLQGFPDDWTLIPWRGRPAAECPDGPRYKALGNSMAVPCMRWLGQRIAEVSA